MSIARPAFGQAGNIGGVSTMLAIALGNLDSGDGFTQVAGAVRRPGLLPTSR